MRTRRPVLRVQRGATLNLLDSGYTGEEDGEEEDEALRIIIFSEFVLKVKERRDDKERNVRVIAQGNREA